MQKKGQLFSLDFIVSMVAVTAAIALLLHSIEVNAYSQKERQLRDELKQVAETAADLLVASDNTSCQLQISGAAGKRPYLVNCVNENANTDYLRGLFPDGYGYQICSDTLNLNCPIYPGGDFYEAERAVVTNAGNISKADFENCIDGKPLTNCNLDVTSIKVRVWRI